VDESKPEHKGSEESEAPPLPVDTQPTFDATESIEKPAAEKKKPRRRRAGDDEEADANVNAKNTISGWGDSGSGDNGGFVKRNNSGWGNDNGGDDDDDDDKPPVRKGFGGGYADDDEGQEGGDDNDDAFMSSATTKSGTAGNRKGRNRHFDDNNGGDDIMLIPDLDDEDAEEDITVQVAAAPKNITRTVASLHELDNDLKFSVSSKEKGIDMSLLVTNLVPASAVQETDEKWDFDSLLQSVTQDFHAERDLLAEEAGTAGGAVASANGSNAANEGGETSEGGGEVKLADEDARKLDELVGGRGGAKPRRATGGRRARGNQ